ncbi:MAG: YdiU family protein, partial [Kofleriaceae bacterium]|nr:YdiU family protein [Kofleriaceae bacterium]
GQVMQAQMEKMWTAKLGLGTFDAALFSELETLMVQTPVEYTIFFRELSTVPEDIGPLKKSFYKDATNPEVMNKRWSEWLTKWKSLIHATNATDANAASPRAREELSRQMKLVNPKFSLREWLVAPAYQQAAAGNYSLVRELQEVMTEPYAEQSKEVGEKYYRMKPSEFFEVGGLSYLSCSS